MVRHKLNPSALSIAFWTSRHGLFLSCFLLLPVLYFFSLPIAVGDAAIWVGSGKYFLQHGELLRHDAFSVLPTREVVYPWGISLIYGLLDWLGGLKLVSVFHKLVALLFVWLSYQFSLRPLKTPHSDIWTLRNLILIAIAGYGSCILCIDRPAMVAVVPFILSFQILNQKDRLGRKQILYLGLIEIIWLTLHGSWILLPTMTIWRAFFRSLHEKKVLYAEWLAVCLMLASTLINPFGFRIWSYVFETASISKARGIDEWSPTGLREPVDYYPQGLTYYALAFCVLVFIFFKIKKSKSPWLHLSSPFFLVMALGPHSIRNTIWIFLSLLPYAASQKFLTVKAAKQERPSLRKQVFNGGIVCSLIAVIISLTPYFKSHISFLLPEKKKAVFDEYSPFDLAQVIRDTKVDAPIFNAWEYGSFLIWALPNKIFIDTRNIIYPEESFKTFLTVQAAQPGWEQILDKYGARFVLINKKQEARLAKALSSSKSWKRLAENKDSLLFFR